ncbi:sorting nexin 13 [Paramecium bursaria]
MEEQLNNYPIYNYLVSPKRKKSILQWEQIQIVEYKLGKHTQYQIEVRLNTLIWRFWSRYKELHQLHENLQCSLNFPSKRYFGNQSKEFLILRIKQLNEYFEKLILQDDLRNSQIFLDFLKQSKKRAHFDISSLQKFRL